MKTNRPLYITKGTCVSVAGMGSKLIDGYEISYSPASVITHDGVAAGGEPLAETGATYQRRLGADPSSLRRPDKLRGLSPWSGRPALCRPAGALATRVSAAVDGLHERGGYVEIGVIVKPDRLLEVVAARDPVVTIGGCAIPLEEDNIPQVFQGPQPPRGRVISTRSFHANVAPLAEYLQALVR